MMYVNIIYVRLINFYKIMTDTYGRKLKEIRKQINASQNEMADLMGVPYRTYAAYERGENNPPYSMLAVLCRNHKINLNWFIADEGSMCSENNSLIEKALALKIEEILKKKGIV